uniref:Si:ch211-215c18.3 n=1 Tax=Oryzias latipes TaxID=8090 RepID=A0A3B3HD15_ORYLA
MLCFTLLQPHVNILKGSLNPHEHIFRSSKQITNTFLQGKMMVDCEFLATDQVPGPYCEYRQDSRLVGSTYPNMVTYVSTDDRRRSNVSLVSPSLCRLTWAPMADEKPYTYTCRVYQGPKTFSSVSGILPICCAVSVMFKTAPWFLTLVISLPVAVGLVSP